jgi:hypothetical protein
MFERVADAYRNYLVRNKFSASQVWFMVICGALVVVILIFIPWNYHH